MAKKTNAKAKPAVKKAAKPAAKPAKKAAAKPAAKPAKAAKPSKPVKVVAATKPVKKEVKDSGKKVDKKEVKKNPVSSKASTSKDNVKVKKTGKPIDAISKKGDSKKDSKPKGKKGKKDEEDEEEEEIPEEEEDDSDVDVKDDYEKTEDDDSFSGELDEAGLVDLEGGGPDLDDDEDEIPEKRGRGRRKKNEGKSSGSSMESYIRNRPLQIDISKPLIKKANAEQPKPFVNTKDNRTRYSDKELAEFKELILDKLKEAQTDYDLLKQTLSNEDDHGTDDTSPSFKLLEDGSDVMSKEETAQLAARQEKYIINLKNALVRIENKTYGICRVTGKLIPKERLRSVPHATLGIDAKLNQSS